MHNVVYLGRPIALSYMSLNKWGGGGGCGVSANEYSSVVYMVAQINFEDLIPYLAH